MNEPLSCDLLEMNAYWRAANYLSVGRTYLFDNPLLDAPLSSDERTRTKFSRSIRTTC